MTWASHPTRVRGLKHPLAALGASTHSVAPHAGAWIETCRNQDGTEEHGSHPTRVRGLKLTIMHQILPTKFWSHPTRVRGLKQFVRLWMIDGSRSHPTRVRGLKRPVSPAPD